VKVLRADDHLVGVVAEIVVLAEHADFGRLVCTPLGLRFRSAAGLRLRGIPALTAGSGSTV